MTGHLTGRTAAFIPVPAAAMAMAVAAAITAIAAVAIIAAPAAAQDAQVPSLEAVDSLIAAGAYDDARANLGRWWSAREAFDVPGSDRARALVLRARLQPEPAAAEADYLAVILGYPTSDQAPEALLRLGQGLLATGQAARAAGYLRRLAADYPGRPQHTLGMLWLARAETAARNPRAACAAAREGLADAGPQPDLAAMLRLEEAASCAIGGPAAGQAGQIAPARETPAPAGGSPPPPARATPEPPASGVAGEPAGSWAVQTGAFRYRDGADALQARLEAAGYDARAVLVPNSTLLRIRVGRFATAGEAAALRDRLRAAGFDAVVVRDADRERVP